MSRAEREIAAARANANEAWRVAEDFRRRLGELRSDINRARKAHPACEGCAASAAELDRARETIDALALELAEAKAMETGR